MKKVVVMITGPYQLLQAIWFYSKHPECEYTALVKNFNLTAQVKEKLLQYCNESEIFKNINFTKGVGFESSSIQKLKLGMKMLIYYIIGKKKLLIKKLVAEEINLNDYDTILVDSEISILGGAFINCAKEKRVIIMQEGLYEMQEQRKFPGCNIMDIIGFFLAKMGYCDIAQKYKLAPTINCEKLLSKPELAAYNNYKNIIKLFDMDGEEREVFNHILKKTFSEIEWSNIAEADIVLFTNQLVAFTDNQYYYEQVYQWLRENAADKKIVIKKHPRDDYLYEWNDLNVSFVEESLPAEILISQITNQKLLFMFFSTCILGALECDLDYTVLCFKNIQTKMYVDVFEELEKKLQVDETHIINLC